MNESRKTFLGLALLALLGLVGLTGCDNVTAEPLRITSEQSEQGWSFATADGVTAACPRTWTLETTNHRRRAWRCSHPQSGQGPGGCGLTVYGTGGASNLDELADRMRPQILDYSEESEVLSESRTTLGEQPAHQFVVRQVINEVPVKGWYRLVQEERRSWLAHCILPEEHLEADEEVVGQIFERISL